MQNKKKEKIKKIAEEFFEKMCFEVEFEVGPIEENTVSLDLKTEEPQILIGEHGLTLAEIQRVLGKILRKGTGEQIFLDLDVNQYKKNKIEYLQDLARSAADEVALTKKEKILSPMSSYERRIIHLELSQREDVKTESIGQEPERRVVIKPA